ncbi:MAG TPA: hypothetical protein VIF62_29745, partial [Labilithrix sp.]
PGTLWKASLTTGDKTTLYPTTESPQGLALVGGTLFWVDNGHHLVGSYGLVTNMVTRKGLDTSVYGDGPPTIAVAANAGLAIGIPGSAGGSLLWIDTTLTTIAPTYSAKPYSIATSPTGPDAFWTDNQAGAVYRASYDQGSATIATLAAAGAENNCESIAASADSVYWTTFSGGGVRRAPIDTGAVEDVAVGESNPQSLAADDTGVYWLTSNGTTGELRHRGPHDGAPKTIFTGLPVSIDDRFLTKIALSPTHIAWYGGTSLYVLRK